MPEENKFSKEFKDGFQLVNAVVDKLSSLDINNQLNLTQKQKVQDIADRLSDLSVVHNIPLDNVSSKNRSEAQVYRYFTENPIEGNVEGIIKEIAQFTNDMQDNLKKAEPSLAKTLLKIANPLNNIPFTAGLAVKAVKTAGRLIRAGFSNNSKKLNQLEKQNVIDKKQKEVLGKKVNDLLNEFDKIDPDASMQDVNNSRDNFTKQSNKLQELNKKIEKTQGKIQEYEKAKPKYSKSAIIAKAKQEVKESHKKYFGKKQVQGAKMGENLKKIQNKRGR